MMDEYSHLSEQELMIAMTIKQIDGLVKEFVKDVCKDMGVNLSQLFYKTEIDKGCYVLSIFRSTDKRMVKYGWTMEEFLMICSNKDKVEYEFNTVIRKLLLGLDQDSESMIWTPRGK